MHYDNGNMKNIKITYVGGGSRGWAWELMKDLAMAKDISGTVNLFDIDFEAALDNEKIGNSIKNGYPDASNWSYKAIEKPCDAFKEADFVIISILPGTFDEMESDVHSPEKYGIYQSVGDTTGPGGIVRALRTVPMMQQIANYIKDYCPEAWVINYTNPMSICVKTLYKTFPGIKAFGCCHEVFWSQEILGRLAEEKYGFKGIQRDDVKINVFGVNHFTWINKATYKNVDLIPLYREFALNSINDKDLPQTSDNWMNKDFLSHEKVKSDLFLRFGIIAAAGDRHLAEFCPGNWYLKSPELVKNYGFGLTTVDWRREELAKRIKKSKDLLSGKEKFELGKTGEEGVRQIRAILGLESFVTNVNLPNMGQITNLPSGTVVETNAVFSAGNVTPVTAGEIPKNIYGLISRIVANQETVVDAAIERDINKAFTAFCNDPLMTVTFNDAKELFEEMLEKTKNYLSDYPSLKLSY